MRPGPALPCSAVCWRDPPAFKHGSSTRWACSPRTAATRRQPGRSSRAHTLLPRVAIWPLFRQCADCGAHALPPGALPGEAWGRAAAAGHRGQRAAQLLLWAHKAACPPGPAPAARHPCARELHVRLHCLTAWVRPVLPPYHLLHPPPPPLFSRRRAGGHHPNHRGLWRRGGTDLFGQGGDHRHHLRGRGGHPGAGVCACVCVCGGGVVWLWGLWGAWRGRASRLAQPHPAPWLAWRACGYTLDGRCFPLPALLPGQLASHASRPPCAPRRRHSCMPSSRQGGSCAVRGAPLPCCLGTRWVPATCTCVLDASPCPQSQSHVLLHASSAHIAGSSRLAAPPGHVRRLAPQRRLALAHGAAVDAPHGSAGLQVCVGPWAHGRPAHPAHALGACTPGPLSTWLPGHVSSSVLCQPRLRPHGGAALWPAPPPTSLSNPPTPQPPHHTPRSDFYSEFQQALRHSPLFPANTRMLVLCNRPSYEFGAFQARAARAPACGRAAPVCPWSARRAVVPGPAGPGASTRGPCCLGAAQRLAGSG